MATSKPASQARRSLQRECVPARRSGAALALSPRICKPSVRDTRQAKETSMGDGPILPPHVLRLHSNESLPARVVPQFVVAVDCRQELRASPELDLQRPADALSFLRNRQLRRRET